jgi:hypothetical protein
MAAAPAAPAVDAKAVKAKIILGDFHFARGEYDDAIANYEEGLKLDPSSPELRQKLEETIKACKEEIAVLGEGLKCGTSPPPAPGPSTQAALAVRYPVVTLIPSGDFQRWNGPVTKEQMLPDNSIEGGLKPVGTLTVPPMDAPAKAFVIFIITIDPNGNVTPGRKTSDDNGLGPQVMATAKGWKFYPPMVKGKPVSTSITVKVTF